MTWSAILPGAALRMTRRAAGRRALHVALLVGGLFVLGVLCAERAQAAEGTPPSLRDAVGQVVDVPVERPREGRGSAVTAENVVGSVGDRFVEPVGHAAETVTEGLGLGAAAQTQVPLSSLPSLPSLPPLPSVPLSSSALPDPSSGPSDLPGPPDLSDLSGLPGWSMPVGTEPRPGPPATVPDTADSADKPDPAATSDPADMSEAADAGTSGRGGGAAHAAHGPEQVAGGASAAARLDTHRAEPAPAPTAPAPTEHAPTRRAPTGDPDGTLGSASGADQGASRQGDAHALTPHHRIPFRLVPGALARADAAETQDRYRDIPVSPA
ncbi:hypothetical protein [Streptomyces sp. NPDC000351]|uniref:hypothetical protein n=1 Tax=Streptomyces sp. NPDC000351 TaxID=3154250 RepID=UPI00332CEB2F